MAIGQAFDGAGRTLVFGALDDGGALVVAAAGAGKSRLLDEVEQIETRRGRRVWWCRARRFGLPTGDPVVCAGEVDTALEAAAAQPTTLLVDDAHLLDDRVAMVIAALTERTGSLDLRVVVARRPGAVSTVVAALEEPFHRAHRVTHLPTPSLDDVELATARAALLDDRARRSLVPIAFGITAGSRAWDLASGGVPADLDAAVDLALAEGVLGDRSLDVATWAPDVAVALRRSATFAERAAVAAATRDAAAPEARATVARHLLAVGDRSDVAGELYETVAGIVLDRDPRLAVAMLDAAIEAGRDPQQLVLPRLRALLAAGEPARVVSLATEHARESGPDAEIGALVAAAWLRLGHPEHSIEAVVAIAELAPGATAWIGGDLPRAASEFDRAAHSAELLGGTGTWPDTPHALGVLLALSRGQSRAAGQLVDRAIAADVGAVAYSARHTALHGLVALRAGRLDEARADLESVTTHPIAGRDALVAAALMAGLALRAGVPGDLPDAHRCLTDALATAAFDLWHTDLLAEVGQLMARVGDDPAPVFEPLASLADRLGDPPAFRLSLAWAGMMTAVAADDAEGASAMASALEEAAVAVPDPGLLLATAGRTFAEVVAGDVDTQHVQQSVDALTERGMAFEASRLAGAAGLRTSDAAAAKSLLGASRRLRPQRVRSNGPGGDVVMLSDREVEIAREVLAGHTHRDIGAKLFISAKTVEHHVARIRQKLSAATRAEMLAGLHDYLARIDAHAET